MLFFRRDRGKAKNSTTFLTKDIPILGAHAGIWPNPTHGRPQPNFFSALGRLVCAHYGIVGLGSTLHNRLGDGYEH